jgi:hypothetical protein
MLLEYKEYKPVGISAKYKYLNQQHSVGKVVLKYNKYTIFNRFLTPSIKLLSITNLGNMPPPLRKFGPLENIVYFIAISSEIVKLLLKPRS